MNTPIPPSFSPSFTGFIGLFRLAAKEALFMRSRAKPGEKVEFEIKIKDKAHGNISGIPRMAWNNAYAAVLAKSNARLAEFVRLGYIVPRTNQPFIMPPKVSNKTDVVFTDPSILNPEALSLFIEQSGGDLRSFVEKFGEYPYKFTTDYPNTQMNWSGPVLQMRSQYVAHLVKPSRGGSTFRLHVNSKSIPGWNHAWAQPTWQQKFTNRANIVDDTDHWLRMTVSTEAPSHKPTSMEGHFTRYISRHSFIIDNARVDFSKVYFSTNKGSFVSHELEIEYIFDTGLSDIPFLTVVSDIVRTMFDSPVMFNRAEYQAVSMLVTREMAKGFPMRLEQYAHINRELFSDAQTLGLHMWSTNFLFGERYPGEPKRIFIAGLKIDGFKMTGIFHPIYGTWLIFPPFQARFCGNSPEHGRLLGMTVFECELYTPPSSSSLPTCWFIDAMVIDGDNIRAGPTYMARRDAFRIWYQTAFTRQKELFDNFPPVIFKNIELMSRDLLSGPEGNRIVPLLTDLWSSRGNLIGNAQVDGIMFTPNWLTYNELCKEKTRSVLPATPDINPSQIQDTAIYKFKPDITIDFIVRSNATTSEIEVFTVDDQQNEVQFQGTRKYPLNGVVMGEIPLVNDTVVEFSVKDRILTAYKPRPDKVRPNSKVVVDDNWQSMASPNNILDVGALLGVNNLLMRRYHNDIKSALLLPKGGGKVLDLGFGRLGDGKKYMNLGYEMVIGIEPDPQAFAEACSRLSKYTPEQQEKFHLAQLRAEDTKNVIPFVLHYAPEGVDTIVMMDSLTFFFGPDRSMMDGLLEVIKTCLKPDGIFIWRCMYGGEVIRKMASVNTWRLPFGEEDSLEYLQEENMMRVKIGRIEQVEYIVDMSQFMEESGLTGDTDCACQEGMLSADYRELSSFFYHGIFSYPSRPKFPAALGIVFGREYNKTEPLSSTSLIDAVESLFTWKSHSLLLDQYWEAGRKEDSLCPVMPKGLEVTKFETAGNAYFTKAYLIELVDSLSAGVSVMLTEKEVLTTQPELGGEEAHSLAFASLLDLDVYVVSHVGGRETLISTNAVHTEVPRSCLIAVFEDGKYSIQRAGPLMPFFSSLSNRIKALGKHVAPNFCELAVQAGIPDVRLPIKMKVMTPIVYRMASCDLLSNDIKIRCLAIYLHSLGRKACEATDLEKIGLDTALMTEVTALLK